uniref:Ig-like domain-containing protein n=1 Tax=Astyanax mexicanus TaxID=7994 RepID=W5KCI6_ASTMX
MFAKRSRIAPGKLTLTCLATGFYPKDVVMTIRKSGTAIPEHLVTSSGVRPNEDATFQMRKIVDIPEKENVQYDCSVTHSSLKEPKIVQWGTTFFLTCPTLVTCFSIFPPERHSLYYIYTTLSKDLDLPGIYEFTALGLLDDREIDYYNSKEQKKIPKQSWMMEKMQEDYWEKGTQSRKSKEQWFKLNVDILMQRMNHNNTDLHVLQWRHGCEIDESNGEVKFLNGISEYGYDGSDFLSFDRMTMTWIAPVPAAIITKQKWDGVAILNQYNKGYLEKECVDWITKFLKFRKESEQKAAPLDVHVFAKPSVSDSSKLTLTCLATGFYPKDATVIWRRSSSPLSEDLITSSAVRPNDDGTYQLRKSVEILGAEKDQYECYVTHRTLKEPVIKKLGKYI